MLQFPRGLQEHLKGQSGGVGDHATRRARSQKTSGAGVQRAASTCGFGTCILSNGNCSVTGPEGQRQSDLVSPHAPRPPRHPHHGAYGRERWPLPEVVREGTKEEVAFGPGSRVRTRGMLEPVCASSGELTAKLSGIWHAGA